MESKLEKTKSLLDFPNEILEHIARKLDTDSLVAFALTNTRLLAIAARLTEHLKISSASQDVQTFLKYRVTTVRSLDLSNCFSNSSSIQAVIFKCRSIEELNVVNSGLILSHLLNVLGSLNELVTLSFTLLNPASLGNKLKRDVRFPVRNVYLEITRSIGPIMCAMNFLNKCQNLENLHLNFFAYYSEWLDDVDELSLLDRSVWQSLKTVVVTCHGSSSPLQRVMLDSLFAAGIERRDFQQWTVKDLPCFIYDHGNLNSLSPRVPVTEQNSNLLQEAYHVKLGFEAENRLELPWGLPRGLKLDCPFGLRNVAHWFESPGRWSSNLAEIDLTQCHYNFPEDFWPDLVASSPALEAVAIPVCLLMRASQQAETSPTPKGSLRTEHKRARLQFNVISSLGAVKLKRLRITGNCSDPNQFCYVGLSSPGLADFDKLSHLEELTLYQVNTNASIFGAMVNSNVRIVRLCITGIQSVAGLKDYIQKCVRLKYFKLEFQGLQLDSALLWDALAHGESLKQICLGTRSKDYVKLAVIMKYLPNIIERIEVLHIHATNVNNRVQLQRKVQAFVKQYVKTNPHRIVHFPSTVSLSSVFDLNLEVLLPSLPGRSLCSTASYIAQIKPPGWDLL